ncbi:hypothetical protein [Confluentibacter sediminis]|uniref:hypothetical protein n=1 Tax=Confluentibacter sediminis TaxID=2219045 RepID=UPI001F1B47BE|nr:hypothetical protein [Confluentibacter sediminis]
MVSLKNKRHTATKVAHSPPNWYDKRNRVAHINKLPNIKKMKIRYTKKRLRYYLIFGILWMVLGSSAIIFESGNVFNYGYLLMGILYLGTYLFENRKQYLTIENGVISKNLLVSKKINLNEITRIKKFAGDYVLKTDLTELKINTGLIDKTSLSDLNAVLDNLNLEKK